MRTAEETAIELFKIFAGQDEWNWEQQSFAQKARWKRLAEYGMRKHDEAVAHGMTLSAEITNTADIAMSDSVKLTTAILTARDNKVWRKE